mmetsp:Transcript_62553/g.71762  ORF Transcript_62553/g.71762 Transcript_62553/m.71762 type:complete len:129 (-) Transcript_62553:62-448(-)
MIVLQQQEARDEQNSKFPFKGSIHKAMFSILRVDSEQPTANDFSKEKILLLTTLKDARDSSKRVSLPAGDYVVVPSTAEVGKERNFALRIYFSCPKDQISICEGSKTDTKGTYIREEETVVRSSTVFH